MVTKNNKENFGDTDWRPLYLVNGKVTKTELEIVDWWNDYPTSVFTIEDTYEIQDITPDLPNLILLITDCDFIEDTVTKALDKIKVDIMHAPNCIAPEALKEEKDQIS